MIGVIKATVLNVRSKPSMVGSILGQLARNTRIAVESNQGAWLQFQYQGTVAYVSARYVDLLPEIEAGLGPDQLLPVRGDGVERQVAGTWNQFGGLLTELSATKDIDVACSISVLCVESAGKGFEPANDNRMIIRFENHKFWKFWGNQHPQAFQDHFQYMKGKAWKGHRWRASDNEPWQTFHGKQDQEWKVLEFARTLDDSAALQSISMGAPQIMGFHYQGLGYASPREMFNEFSSGIAPQINGLFEFLTDTMLLRLRTLDFEGFAALYNGTGQKQHYGRLLKRYYTAYKRISG